MTNKYIFQINHCYEYLADEQSIINEWKSSNKIDPSDWSLDSFKDIKSNLKDFYIKEQRFRCSYCLQKQNTKRHDLWDLEHIIPRSEMPEFMFEPENLCVVCKDCNSNKREYNPLLNKKVKNLPKGSKRYKLVHSHFDEYSEHIKCVMPGKFYIPRNEKGEESIYVYKLNRFYKYQDRRIENHEEDINDLAIILLQTNDPEERDRVKKEILFKTINQKELNL